MTEDENATLVMLAKAATRGSASYEYEIDTLREALRRLCSYNDGTAECDAHFTYYDWQSAWDQARAAIDRTDWRAP